MFCEDAICNIGNALNGNEECAKKINILKNFLGGCAHQNRLCDILRDRGPLYWYVYLNGF